MKQYEVRLAKTETLTRSVLIWAEHEGEAEDKALYAYEQDEYEKVQGEPDSEDFPTLGGWSCADHSLDVYEVVEFKGGKG